MKAIYITALLGVCSASSLFAQNTPNNSGYPSTTLTGKVSPPPNFNQSPNLPLGRFNYIRKYSPLSPVSSIGTFDNTRGAAILVNTTYTDGWGNPIMDLIRNNSPLNKDVAVPYDYRNSNVSLSYLPYATDFHSKFQNDLYTRQKNFYTANFPLEDETAYGKSTSYASNGVQTSRGFEPGRMMVGLSNGSTNTVHINGSGEVSESGFVMKLAYSSPTNGVCSTGYYLDNELVVKQSLGPHGEELLSFIDRQGRLICKRQRKSATSAQLSWLSTYYVYNEMGKLVYVVPPKIAQQIKTGICSGDIKKHLFEYKYDDEGFLTSKQVPGKTGADIAVYDKYNRAVLNQSPLMRAKNQWFFTLYDRLNRVLMTGVYTGTDAITYWEGIINGTTTPLTRPLAANQTLEYWLTNTLTKNKYPDTLYNCIIHSYNYYDTYADTPASYTTFDNSYSGHYLSSGQIVAPQPHSWVYGRLVATRTRILTDGAPNNFDKKYLTTVYFYDEKGQVIQTKTRNPWQNEWDIVTNQYNFSGQVVLNIVDHKSWTTANKNATKIITKYTYGYNTGRLQAVEQKIDTNGWYTIAGYTYDNLGRVEEKNLGNVERQGYSYNIRGELIGINASHLRSALLPDDVSYMSELNYESGFDQRRYDGSLTGYKWRSKSSEVRAYGYVYDVADRVTTADYRDSSYATSGAPSATWNKTKRDFTVSGLTYDYNGNIQTMNQRGYNTAMNPASIDLLNYEYDDGNQLINVEDGGVVSPIEDFVDGPGSSFDDYEYDADGNLKIDRNKGIDLIEYSIQGLPVLIAKGTDTIRKVYDANGSLLQKTVKEGSTVNYYRYWGPFSYKDDTLEYIIHDEGRARWISDSNFFQHDFFVKDHQGNVRTVITAEVTYQPNSYIAGFELVNAAEEENVFAQIGVVRDNKPSGTPLDLMSAILNGCNSAKRVGAALLLHAMAGDQLNLQGWGYYEAEDTNQYNIYAPGNDMLNALSTTLVNAIPGGGGEGTMTASTVSNLLSGPNYTIYEGIKDGVTDRNYPRAYLNYLVFNEDFELQPNESHVIQLTGSVNDWHFMNVPHAMNMRSNGYVIAYFSNESCIDVAFDNLEVVHYQGTLIQEQHYYPHGLVIDAGQNASYKPENKFLFEGNEKQDELGLHLYDFNARQYDQQLGRFTAIDPLADKNGQEMLSPYHFVGNDPANYTDPSGLLFRWLRRLFGGGGYGCENDLNHNGGGGRIRMRGGPSVDPQWGGGYGVTYSIEIVNDEGIPPGGGGGGGGGSNGGGGLSGGSGGGGGASGYASFGSTIIDMEGNYYTTATGSRFQDAKLRADIRYRNKGYNQGMNGGNGPILDGVRYDLVAFSNWYDKHSNAKVKYWYGEPFTGSDDFIDKDGHHFRGYAETSGNLVLAPTGIVPTVTTGKNTNTSNELERTDQAVYEFMQVSTIHTHLPYGSVSWRDATHNMGGYRGVYIYRGPSPSQQLGDWQKVYGNKFFSVIVDDKYIYLYRNYNQKQELYIYSRKTFKQVE